jgi:hypothetical protein
MCDSMADAILAPCNFMYDFVSAVSSTVQT